MNDLEDLKRIKIEQNYSRSERLNDINIDYGVDGTPCFESLEKCVKFEKDHQNQNDNDIYFNWTDIENIVTNISKNNLQKLIIKNKNECKSHPNLIKHDMTNNVFSRSISSDSDSILLESLIKSLTNAGDPVDFNFDKIITELQSTLLHMFHHRGHGIFIHIENNNLKTFAPMLNKNYQNNRQWTTDFRKYPSWEEYQSHYHKTHHHRGQGHARTPNPTQISQRYQSSFIINNIVIPITTIEKLMRKSIYVLKNLFSNLCLERKLNDCYFCIDLFSNYDDNENNLPHPIIPIYYLNKINDDHQIIIPSKNDWLIATGLYFPYEHHLFINNVNPAVKKNKILDHSQDKNLLNNFTNISNISEMFNFKSTMIETETKTEIKTKTQISENDWLNKKNILFFRGSTLSCGSNKYSNNRLSLCSQDRKKKFIQLDASITSIDSFERIIDSQYNTIDFFNNIPIDHIDNKDSVNESRINKEMYCIDKFISLKSQINKYKYFVHIDSGFKSRGNYPFLMKHCVLIFKVNSDQQGFWFSSLLRPMIDHIPIRSDLSDLHEKYKWAENNQDQCLQIIKNAKYLFDKFLSRNSILDFWQILINIKKKTKEDNDFDNFKLTDNNKFINNDLSQRLEKKIENEKFTDGDLEKKEEQDPIIKNINKNTNKNENKNKNKKRKYSVDKKNIKKIFPKQEGEGPKRFNIKKFL